MSSVLRKLAVGRIVDYLGMALVLAGLVLCFSSTTRAFFTRGTFLPIVNQIPAAIILAVGMTYVLVIGGIDLSVGSVLALSGAVFGVLLVDARWPLPAALAGCLATGLLCGAVNGLIAIRWQVPSFIVTLGMLEVARGGAYRLIPADAKDLGAITINPKFFGVSTLFLCAIVLVLIAQAVLARTVLGRYMVAIGTNEEVVRLSGIDPRPTKLAVFMLSGLCAAAAGIITCEKTDSANPNAGAGYELQAIAAVVIGGTSLMGGRGSAFNSFLGVLIMEVLGTGLTQAEVADPVKRLLTGAVIVLAVILDRYRHRTQTTA
jgi:ribose transport system permease protein